MLVNNVVLHNKFNVLMDLEEDVSGVDDSYIIFSGFDIKEGLHNDHDHGGKILLETTHFS